MDPELEQQIRDLIAEVVALEALRVRVQQLEALTVLIDQRIGRVVRAVDAAIAEWR